MSGAIAQQDLFRDIVVPLFEATRADYLEAARNVAHQLADRFEEVTVDDVRAWCPPPDDFDPRVMGAVFTTKDWECVGYRKSHRVTCHKRPIGIFRRVGEA